MSELRIYQNDVIDTVIAASPEDATTVLVELTGALIEDGSYNWTERTDLDKPLTVLDSGPNGETLTLTGREWIAKNGRGFLCSTEF